MGVVYDPIMDECYTAQRGKGAFLNGVPLQVSSANQLIQSLLVTGFPYDIRENPENNLDHYSNFTLCSQGVRRLGSAALELCYVAAGRFDGFWEVQIQSYDIAAGALIVEEAGGQITDVRGGPDFLKPPCSILATNGHIHQAMLDVLSERVVEENEPEWASLGQRDILEAMDRLTPMYRAVFNLYAIEGYGHREISMQLGISEGTSKSNYAKARRNLRELLRQKLREQ